MRKIYAVGESLLDVISKNNKIIARKAGGSMLNASVSMARMGLFTFLISELGQDKEGEIIEDFLTSVGVNKTFIYKFNDGNTAIARAKLDVDNNADYSFEKKYPSQRLKINIPNFTLNDILLFGSIYSIEDEISSVLRQIISVAQNNHSLIFYDPNIRKANFNLVEEHKIVENLNFANIVRASNEDFENVFGVNKFEDACLCIPNLNSKIFIFTCAENGVYLWTPLFSLFFDTPQVFPVSTIGAGDSFNAGLIHAFHLYNVKCDNLLKLEKEVWDEIIKHAIRFATDVCMSYDNYISDEFAKIILDEIGT